jgi:hypothetical protein
MKTYKYPIKKLSPCGLIINIDTVVNLVLPKVAKIDYWHNEHLIGFILCEVGEMAIFEATDFLIEGYFKSGEFKAFRKEAGKWN